MTSFTSEDAARLRQLHLHDEWATRCRTCDEALIDGRCSTRRAVDAWERAEERTETQVVVEREAILAVMLELRHLANNLSEADDFNRAENIRDALADWITPPSDSGTCPFAKGDMTPCVNRDGEMARANNGQCVGCGVFVVPSSEKPAAPPTNTEK